MRTVPIRSAQEIEGLRAACRLAREVLDKAHAAVRPGVTTDEIDRVVRQLSRHLYPPLRNLHASCKRCNPCLTHWAALHEQVHDATIAAGAYPSPLNYFSFPKSVCTSVNEVRNAPW